MPLRLRAGLRTFGFQAPVSSVRQKLARFHAVVQKTWKHLVNDLVAQRWVFDRKRQFDPTVEISRHPICAREEDLGLTGIFEVKNPAVLEKPANDTYDANVLAEIGNFGTQTTDTADDQIDRHLCAGSFVEFFDDLLIDQRI